MFRHASYMEQPPLEVKLHTDLKIKDEVRGGKKKPREKVDLHGSS